MIPTPSRTISAAIRRTSPSRNAQHQAQAKQDAPCPIFTAFGRRWAYAFCLGVYAALLTALSGALHAQTALVAGAVSSFGSSLTNAASIAVDGAQNAYVLTSTGAVYKEVFDNTSNSYTESQLFSVTAGSAGIAVNAAGTKIYVGVVTGTAYSVQQFTGSGTSFAAPSTIATGFQGPTALGLDSTGNVYIADRIANTLTKETVTGGSFVRATIAIGLNSPAYLAVDSSGDIFVATSNNVFYEFSGSGVLYARTTLTTSTFTLVTGLAVDAKGNLFVSGIQSTARPSEIYELSLNGSTYVATPYYAYTSTALALDGSGNIYMASVARSNGTKLTVGNGYLDLGSVGPGTPASLSIAFTETSAKSATLSTPNVVTQGLSGYDFTLDNGNPGTCSGTTLAQGASCTVNVLFSPKASGSRLGAINLVSGTHKVATSYLGGVGFAPLAAYQSVTLLNTISTSLSNGRGITVDPSGAVWVANSTASEILKFPAGSSMPAHTATTNTCQPVGTALDGAGNLFYTCNNESNIYELVGGTGTAVAIPISYNGTSYSTDDHLGVDAAGNLYPTSYKPVTNLFFKVDADTQAVSLLATAPSSARFVGAVTDAKGNTFAPDYNNNVLYELPAGANALVTLNTSSAIQAPHAIAEDAAGNLYVATTVPNTTGNGSYNLLRFTADNYSAEPATIAVPGGDSLYITPDGDFYTVYGNNTLAVYSRSIFALTFPDTAVGQKSASQTVTFENDGTAPLTISPPTTGTNPSTSANFTYDASSTCPALSTISASFTLPASASCTQVIAFTPQQVGSITGNLVTTDNSANVAGSTQTIKMSANATAGTPVVTVASASGTLGQSVNLSATVSFGGTAPTGAVTFMIGTTAVSAPVTCTLGTGSETCTVRASTSTGAVAGTNTVTASIAADTNYSNASGTGTLTLDPAPTTSKVTAAPASSTFGVAVTFTGTVTSTYGVPGGTVTFFDGTTALGTGALTNGVATFTTAALTGGTHAITVGYPTTGNFALSTSPTLNYVVNPTSAYTNVLTTSNAAPSFGSSVTFTDTLQVLQGIAPTGTVTFKSGSLVLGTGTVNSSGVATLTVGNLPVGVSNVTAVYGGNANYNGSTSAAVQENVTPASVISSLATSNAAPTFGGSITLTDTLPVLASTAPTGTVTFKIGSVILGTAPVNGSGVATLSTTALPAGTQTVTAVYGGDGNYNPSTSNPVAENVAKANVPSFVLASSNATPMYGTGVTFTANLGAIGGNYPTGTVSFLNGTTSIGTGTISATGVATLTTSSLPVGTDAITVSYGGDSNFNASTSNAVSETVAKANVPSDVLTSSNLTPVFGTSITLTDTLGQVNGTYPSGTVTFYNGTAILGTGTLNATGVATLSLATLPGGANQVKAVFNGDATFNAANSNVLTENVSKANVPGDVLTTSAASVPYGTSITFTDTVAALNGIYPTGTVTFYSNGTTVLGTGTLNSSGVATFTTSSLPVNTYAITAGYPGDGNYNTATSNSVQQTVTKVTGYSNALTTGNPNPSFGSSVTLTDTIAPVNNTFPTGVVTFYLGGTNPIGTGTLSASGVATLTTSALPAGTDAITAVFGGDATFANSTSNTVTENVEKATVPNHVLSTSSANPSFGASVTLTDVLAPVSGKYPSGTITFLNGSTPIGTGTLSTTGIATLTTSALPVGTDTITATYGGDGNFNTSTSNAVTVNVAKATGYSDVLATSNAAPSFGTNVTLTNTLAPVNGVYPTGSVTFLNGTTVIGTAPLNAAGVAALSTATLPAGSNTITAQYNGDQTFAGATSNAVVENVAKATGYGDVLSTSNSSPAFGTAVTLTNTVAAVNGVYPTGTVTFKNGPAVIGTANLANGVATLTLSTLPVGTDDITASYGGDSNFAAATSNTVHETVTRAAGYGNVLTSSDASPAYGTNVTFTDTLPAVTGVYPTGTVTFSNGSTPLGTGTLNNGVATLTIGSLPVGASTITATYAGDANFAGSTSNALTENVGKAAVPSDVLTASNTAPNFGASVTLTDTLGPIGANYPTGTVTFVSGTTQLGTATINAAGVATLTTSALPTGSNAITATYGGDASFNNVTSNTVTVLVGKAQGTNNLVTSNSTPSFGSNVTLTATLSTIGGVVPTGTVTFSAGSLVLGTANVHSTGTATLTTSALPVGSSTVTATYDGDTNYSKSVSNTITENVGKADLSGDVAAAAPTSVTLGQSTMLTDTLTGVNGVVPTGSVVFKSGTTVIGTAAVDTNGVATLSFTPTQVTTYSITAAYSGDSNYNVALATAPQVTVNKLAATNNDTVSGSGIFGAPTTAVTVIIPFTASMPPTGDITVADTHGNHLVIPAASCLVGTSTLTCTGNLPTANEPVGNNAATVSQAGDATYTGSTGTGIITISRSGPTTGDSATGTGTYGAATTAVTVTIPFKGATPPAGVVSVADSHGNTTSVAASSCSVSGAVLTCGLNLPTANEPVGANPVTVNQAADSNYGGSTGQGTVTIGKAPATNNDRANGTGTFGAATTPVVVTIPYAGVAAPTGAITVADGLGNTIAIAASGCTASGGNLTCTVNLPTANEPTGNNALSVSQAGDSNYSGSTGSGSIDIQPAGTRTDASAFGSGFYGNPTTPITVLIPYSGSAPTGTLAVVDNFANSITIAAANCQSSGGALVCSATMPTANEPVGSNVVTVSQAADANHAAGNGTGTITIAKAAASSGDTASGTGTYGATASVITVTIPYAGAAAPTGAVMVADSFGNTATVQASACTANNHQLTCVLNLPTASESLGTNPLTVAQAADGNYNASTGTGSVTISMSKVSPLGSTSGGVQNVTINQGTPSTLLTAVLTYSGALPPSGAVSFALGNGQSVAASCSVSGSQEICTALYPTGTLQVGTYTITATEAADANYPTGTATGTLTVAAGAVAPILDTVSNVSNVLITMGTQSAPLSATITFNGPVPTGNLVFSVPGGQPVTGTCTSGTSPVVCTANYPTAALEVGTYVITATETSDANYPQGSATALLTVEPNASTPVSPILVTGSNVSSVLVPFGSATATLTANIVYSGPVPTGAVTFTVHDTTGAMVPASCTQGSGSTLTCTAAWPTANLGIGSYRIEVDEAADANYPAGSAIGTLTVTQVAAGVNDTVSGNGTYGAATTPITVTIPYVGSTQPTGAITITDTHGNTVTVSASACTASNSLLTCAANLPTANVPVGSDQATVTQAADATYAASSGTGKITIGKAPATANDTATGNGAYGAATAPVTINIPYAGAQAPTGAITLSDSNGATVTVQASSCSSASGVLTCTATFPTATLPLGSNPLTVSQAADANYMGSTGTGAVTIGKAAATSNDTATGAGTYGAATTTVAITIPYAGVAAPTGAVTLADALGNTVTVPASSCTAANGTLSCTAQLPTANEPVGNNAVSISQAGDANYSGSTGTGTVTIKAGSATITVTGSGNYGGTTTTITVTVPYSGAKPPSGAITVTDTAGNTVTIPASSCTAANNVLTCTGSLPTANVPVGPDTLTVTQAPDGNYSGNTGTGSVTIAKANATTTDTATGTGTYGAPTTAVTVHIPFAGSTAPSGAVTVTDGFNNSVTVQASSCAVAKGELTCTANLPTANEPVGSNPVTLSQAADANYSGSTGSGTITINPAAAGALTISGTGTYGAATTTVTISIPYTGSKAPTGAITLTDTQGNTVTIAASSCTAMAGSLSCTAVLPTANVPAGADAVTVSQAADGNYGAATGTGSISIGKAPATTKDTASGTGTYGAASTSVTITIPYAGAVAPTGAVGVTDSFGNTATIPSGSCTAASGVLTCIADLHTANEPVGNNPVAVTQVGDANYSGSTGSGTVTINPAAGGADTATGEGTYGAATTPITVSIPFTGSAAPTGGILVTDGYNNSVHLEASACKASNNVLTCTADLATANEPVGANPLSVAQGADTNHAASTGTGTLTLGKALATSTDTVTGTGTFGSATTQVTVTIPYTGRVAPTGAITVTDTLGNTVTVAAASCTAGTGVLTCTANLPTANVPVGPVQLTVAQAGDANYSGSTGAGQITIAQGAGSTLSATGTGIYGAASTPVTVSIPYTGTVAPTGVVTVADTLGNTVSVQASACTAGKNSLSCTANLPTANEPVGANTLSVTQAADANYAASTGTGSVTINKAGATTGDTASGSGTYGGATTQVTVTIPYTGVAAPTGAIVLSDSLGNTVTVPAGNCTATKGLLSCTADLPTANAPAGTTQLTITQAPDANYSGSTGTGSVTIGKANPTLTAPAVSPMNSPVGTSVTLTETVPSGLTGTVTFSTGSTVLGTATITNGVATLTTSALPEGANTITAKANGDSNYNAAVSPAVTDTVGGGKVSVALSASQATVSVGTSVTFTANLSIAPATAISGTVTFLDGTTAIGTAPVNNGVATLSTSVLTVGTHTVTATFTPAASSTLASATSAALTETVQAVAVNIALTSSANPAIVQQAVTFSATVPVTISGVIPTGKVTFYDGNTVLGTALLNPSGVATFTTSAMTGGAHTVTASYAGDANYGTVTSAPVAQKISDFKLGNTTPTLTVDPGSSAAFNITVNAATSDIGFAAPVVLTVSGLPAGASSSFAQGTLTPGTNTATTTMTVQTLKQTLTAMEHHQHVKSLEAAAAWACLLPFLGLRRARRRLPKALLVLLVFLGTFGAVAPLTGCGGGYFGPQPSTYTLTVTGTSGQLQRTTTVTLNIR